MFVGTIAESCRLFHFPTTVYSVHFPSSWSLDVSASYCASSREIGLRASSKVTEVENIHLFWFSFCVTSCDAVPSQCVAPSTCSRILLGSWAFGCDANRAEISHRSRNHWFIFAGRQVHVLFRPKTGHKKKPGGPKHDLSPRMWAGIINNL